MIRGPQCNSVPDINNWLFNQNNVTISLEKL